MLINYLTCFYLIILLILEIVFCDEIVNVNLGQGVLSGKVERTFLNKRDYFAFRGVPYAEPPLGALRFLPPKPHNGWHGTYKALETKETCLQFNGRMRNKEPFGISGSEDCLYLSVYTPSVKGSYPVIVFDYNDNFRTSFNGTRTYSPDFFVENDVIIVTISHRLGVFGYLSTEDNIIPGNAGLKDYILGLKWIKDNIKHFGGNPEKVTLMGNRGGAAIVDMLLYSEKATGLFSGAILQSGTSLETIYFPENVRQSAFKLGTILNVTASDSETLLKELQNTDANVLLRKESEVVDLEKVRNQQMSIVQFSPIIEHDHSEAVLTSLPDISNVVNDVPIIIGFNTREGLDLASHYVIEPRLVIDTHNEFLMHFPVRSNFRFDRDSAAYAQAEREIKDFYFEEGEFNIYTILNYTVYVGDMLQMYASDFAAQKLSKELLSPVFYYVFDFRGHLNENIERISSDARFSVKFWGATITDELCYMFLCSRIHDKYLKINELPSEQKEMKVLKRIVRMWANFARTRNPTPDNDEVLKGIIWKPLKSGTEKEYLHITKQFTMKTNPLDGRLTFWDNFLMKYSQKAINGVVTDHDEL